MAASDWWDVMCAILLLAGVGGAGDPCLVVRAGFHGSLGIGKFHAWLLMIGGILCVPSCYWLAWVGW